MQLSVMGASMHWMKHCTSSLYNGQYRKYGVYLFHLSPHSSPFASFLCLSLVTLPPLFARNLPAFRCSTATFLYAKEAKPVVPVLILQDAFTNSKSFQEKQGVLHATSLSSSSTPNPTHHQKTHFKCHLASRQVRCYKVLWNYASSVFSWFLDWSLNQGFKRPPNSVCLGFSVHSHLQVGFIQFTPWKGCFFLCFIHLFWVQL